MVQINTNIIPQDVALKATNSMKEAINTLTPYVVALTPAQRRKLAKSGNKTFSFIDKAMKYAQQNVDLLPGFVTAEEMKQNMDNYSVLLSLLQTATQLSSSLNDTTMQASSDSYSLSLDYYNSAKQGAKKNIPNAKDIYKDLSARFPGRKKRKPSPVKQNEPTPVISNNEQLKVA